MPKPKKDTQMDNDDKFWNAVERADQRYTGNHDKREWIDAVVKAGADRVSAEQMFADAHGDHA